VISKKKPWRAALLTLIVCAVLGPLIGGVVFFTGEFLAHYTEGSYRVLKFFMKIAFQSTYFFGGLPAILFGVAMVVYGWLWGKQPLWFALLLVVILIACFSYFLHLSIFRNASILLVLSAALTISGGMCWLISRRFWQAPA
jgi:hypothetical protein